MARAHSSAAGTTASRYLGEFEGLLRSNSRSDLQKLVETEPCPAMLALAGEQRRELVVEMFRRMAGLADEVSGSTRPEAWPGSRWTNFHTHLGSWYAWCDMLTAMFRKDCRFTDKQWREILSCTARFKQVDLRTHKYLPTLYAKFERSLNAKAPADAAIRRSLRATAEAVGSTANAAEQRLARRIFELLERPAAPDPIRPPASREGKRQTPMTNTPIDDPASRARTGALLGAMAAQAMTDRSFYHEALDRYPEAKQLLSLQGQERALALVMAVERCQALKPAKGADPVPARSADAQTREQCVLVELIGSLLPTAVKDLPDRLDTLAKWSLRPIQWQWQMSRVHLGMLRAAETEAKSRPLSPIMHDWLLSIREKWSSEYKPDHARIARVNELLGEAPRLALESGEAWSDQALADIGSLSAKEQAAWTELVSACRTATSGSPSAKWLKSAQEHVRVIGPQVFAESLCRWFPLVDRPRTAERPRRSQYEPEWTNRIIDPHMDVLKGFCWIAATIKHPDLIRALGRLAISAYRKVPGLGPRAVKVGNAAVYALGQTPGMDAVGQLAMLRVKVKFGTAQKLIEKALTAAAEREGLPREEIEELGVPTYGLTEVGRMTDELEGYKVELVVTGIGDTELRWTKPDGKAQKSVPAAVKEKCAEELKEFKAAAKDIGAMLPAQRDRIDSLFLENKSWPLGAWRERYLDHPLVGVLARRLIWRFADSPNGPWTSATWLDESGQLADVIGKPITALLSEQTIVRLWHPIDAAPDEVLAWRRFFEDRQIKQPFKQAHREVYLLTDAERNTGTYSNRFAAHVIRQHQYNALCGVRGWKNKLRLMVDSEYPPSTRRLPAWNLRAEYWVEGVGDDYGTDTTESGAFNLLTTDQVRFYPMNAGQVSAHASGGGYGGTWRHPNVAEGLTLDQIPPLVFSEIMRDVDLFVGVCSVGNNPQWNDGGPGGVHRDYWWGYSFGDLTEAGKGRREILERLVPRLKIGTACSFSDKFLVVKGKIRTYKIHLGSGNILMEPNDQYLCIVPSGAADSGKVFLPFEGDRTLSIILSKALMLAEDEKIGDKSILSQIRVR